MKAFENNPIVTNEIYNIPCDANNIVLQTTFYFIHSPNKRITDFIAPFMIIGYILTKRDTFTTPVKTNNGLFFEYPNVMSHY